VSFSATKTVFEPIAPDQPEPSVQRSNAIVPQTESELLDARALARRWSTSVRTIRRLIAGGGAPRPVQISARVIRWRLSEVRRWEAALEKGNATAP
jgi:predicted DNA-binding transcriptional regulator AlpA